MTSAEWLQRALPAKTIPCHEDPRWDVPEPGDWYATEVEVMEFMFGLVRAYKPNLVVETGTYLGHMTRVLGAACSANGHGYVVSCDVDAELVAKAQEYCAGYDRIEIRHCAALDLPELAKADLVFIDSGEESRIKELRTVKGPAVMVMHDTRTNRRLSDAAKSLGGAFIQTARGITLWGAR